MESNFKYHQIFSISDETILAADKLIASKLYRQATVLLWQAVRESIFGWLEMKQIDFASTREALVLSISHDELVDISDQIIFIYIIGTMAEWNESFQIKPDQTLEFRKNCVFLTNWLQKQIPQEKQ